MNASEGPVVAGTPQRAIAEWMAAGSDTVPIAEMADHWMPEAADLLDHLAAAGFVVVLRGCLHEFDPACRRCRTLGNFQPWLTSDASLSESR